MELLHAARCTPRLNASAAVGQTRRFPGRASDARQRGEGDTDRRFNESHFTRF